MSTEQEQFEKLRVLLTLKRHEQPPPGYFNRLSADILEQIRVEHGARGEEQRAGFALLLRRFWHSFESRPVFAGSLGLAVCCLLLAGIAYNTTPVATPETTMPLYSTSFQNPDAAPVVLSQQFPAAATLLPSAQVLLASTGEVHSLTPSPLQRDIYVLPAVDFR